MSPWPYGVMEVVSQAILKAGSHDRQKSGRRLRASAFRTVMGRWKVDENNLNERDGLTFQILGRQAQNRLAERTCGSFL